RRLILERGVRLADPSVADQIAQAGRVVGDSPALQAREREIVAEFTAMLAALVAEESGAEPGDVEPAVVAGALMAAHRRLVGHVRACGRAGRGGPALADELQAQGERAFGRLERGLAGYGTRPRS